MEEKKERCPRETSTRPRRNSTKLSHPKFAPCRPGRGLARGLAGPSNFRPHSGVSINFRHTRSPPFRQPSDAALSGLHSGPPYIASMAPATEFYVYLLQNTKTHKFYIGYAANPQRRLRQHNRIIKGGAKCTRAAPPCWEIVNSIGGYKTRSEALKAEKRMQKYRKSEKIEAFVIEKNRKKIVIR